ncbi:porin [Ekhidna lutea]|uniref:Porin n=1 Tax=Ekhidna lutea TaxID=447679 RepID=A0A239LCU9_EKHLU|nr:carbohydrate porin [Ekhidna lutea]SNT28477.1 porin [Ekhidna lutea]
MNRKVLVTILSLYSLFINAQSDSTKSWLELEAVYSALPWFNAHGGLETGFVYMDNADVTAKINFDQLLNLKDNFSLFVYGLGNHGDRATDLMGDFQVASNIEAVKAWRVFELWIQNNFLDDRLSVLVGLYDLNSEFDVLRPGTLFINSSFGIGAEYAQSGLNGPSIFPISSLGIRMATFIGDRTRVRLAILDAVSGDPENLKSNEIHLSRKEGALISGEVSIYTDASFSENNLNIERSYVTRRRKVGREHEVYKNDKVNIGGWYYTSEFEAINDQSSSHGNYGVYIGAQKYMPIGEKGDFASLFGRYGVASSRFNRFGSALSGGVVVSNPITTMDDNFGLAFSSGINGAEFQEIQGSSETTETVIEFTYSLPLASWFLLQPDVQYVINPSTQQELMNPLSFAMLVQISFKY